MKKYSYVFFLIFINILLLSTLDTLKLEYLGETTTKGIYVFDFISNDEILFYEMFDKFYTLNPKGEKKAYIDDKIEGITFIDIGENEILYSRFEHYLIGELYIIDKDTLKQRKIEKFSKNCPKKAFWIDQSNIIFQKPMRYYDESEQFEIRKLNLITNEEETILNNYSLIEYYNYNLLLRNQEEDSVNKHKYFLYNTKNDFLLLLNIEDNLR
ncbi:MAG: hypothetical protein MI922_30600, partial [Bacteroidales bacterium]|nr:hypothetical protein [Bacteroidales bacterium]